MEEIVRDLVVAPFQEIVAKGKTALENAEDAEKQPMLRASQALVREGERAVKKIEPLCKKYLDEFTSSFADALKENDEIAQYRTDLNDLLWEFDDYIDADSFDADKFSELRALSRKAAPRILDVLMRMKLEAPVRAEPSLASPASPVAPSPITVSVEPDDERSGSNQEAGNRDGTANPPSIAGTDLRSVMGAQSGPDLGLDGDLQHREHPAPSRTGSHRSRVSSIPEEAPPEPDANPWQLGSRPAVDAIAEDEEVEDSFERRRRVSAQPDSETLSDVSLRPRDEPGAPVRLDVGLDRMMREVEQGLQRMGTTSSFNTVNSNFSAQEGDASWGAAPRATATSTVWRPSPPAPAHANTSLPSQQNRTLQSYFSQPNGQLQPAALSLTADNASSRHSQASSTNDSHHSLVFENYRRDSQPEATSPATSVNRNSGMSAPATSPVATSSAPPQSQPYSLPPPIPEYGQLAAPADQAGLEHVSSATEGADGLIPVDADRNRPQTPLRMPRQPDCTIRPTSSFSLLKGFCDGAKEAQRGGAGVKQTRKMAYGGSVILAAKCKHCLYELEWKQVEADILGSPDVNFKSSGIGFRLRFLQKSHLPVKHVEDQVYACLFCVQLGRTPEESDATVFFSQAQLFAHVSRHCRPLPVVPGVTVIDTPEIPLAFRNDYDVHLSDPPRPSVMEGIRREIQLLPAATASETFRRTNNTLRRPPGGADPLQFAAGAKIVGVEFASRYNGEWAVGWADNVRAPFPMDAVRLDPPPKAEIAVQGASPMRAVARWKWHPKEKERGDWLKFEKGETISNISWPYPGHWCWSGTNAKGRWGLFPQAFMEPNTLRESAADGDGASVHNQERKTSILSKMAIRHRKAGSSGASTSSHETAVPPSPRPSIY